MRTVHHILLKIDQKFVLFPTFFSFRSFPGNQSYTVLFFFCMKLGLPNAAITFPNFWYGICSYGLLYFFISYFFQFLLFYGEPIIHCLVLLVLRRVVVGSINLLLFEVPRFWACVASGGDLKTVQLLWFLYKVVTWRKWRFCFVLNLIWGIIRD